jgi:hypothetical protein
MNQQSSKVIREFVVSGKKELKINFNYDYCVRTAGCIFPKELSFRARPQGMDTFFPYDGKVNFGGDPINSFLRLGVSFKDLIIVFKVDDVMLVYFKGVLSRFLDSPGGASLVVGIFWREKGELYGSVPSAFAHYVKRQPIENINVCDMNVFIYGRDNIYYVSDDMHYNVKLENCYYDDSQDGSYI